MYNLGTSQTLKLKDAIIAIRTAQSAYAWYVTRALLLDIGKRFQTRLQVFTSACFLALLVLLAVFVLSTMFQLSDVQGTAIPSLLSTYARVCIMDSTNDTMNATTMAYTKSHAVCNNGIFTGTLLVSLFVVTLFMLTLMLLTGSRANRQSLLHAKIMAQLRMNALLETTHADCTDERREEARGCADMIDSVIKQLEVTDLADPITMLGIRVSPKLLRYLYTGVGYIVAYSGNILMGSGGS